jgi:large subunit ribosomal protein L25
MHQVTLKAEKRERTGKQGNKQIRREGMVSGVIYGKGMENVLVKVNARDMKKALTTSAGARVIFNLEVDDKGKKETYTTMAIEVDKDIYQKEYYHVDFHHISLKEKVTTEVPVDLVGESRGVKIGGGMMDHVMRTVTIKAFPLDIPESIKYDVTNMNEGEQLKVKDLTLSEKVEVLDDPEESIAIIHPPRVAETEGGAVAGVATPETAGAAGE